MEKPHQAREKLNKLATLAIIGGARSATERGMDGAAKELHLSVKYVVGIQRRNR